jgi:hypothetical protein
MRVTTHHKKEVKPSLHKVLNELTHALTTLTQSSTILLFVTQISDIIFYTESLQEDSIVNNETTQDAFQHVHF